MKTVSEILGISGAGMTAPRPWGGGLDEAELRKPGGMMMAALVQCANERHLSIPDMALAVGVTYGYINQLRNGLRDTTQVSDEFTESCAAFLQVPRLTILILSGKVTPVDFLPPVDPSRQEVQRAFDFVCTDPVLGPLFTGELRMSGLDSKYAIVRMYEKCTGKNILDSHIDPEQFFREVDKVQRSLQSDGTGS